MKIQKSDVIIVKETLENRMEDMTIPNLMLEWCEANQGKKLRKNNLPDCDANIRKAFGQTHLENMEYWRTSGSKGWSFLIAYDEKNVVIPSPEWFREKNPAYFRGAEDRNSKRREILGDIPRIRKISEALRKCKEAQDAHESAQIELGKIMADAAHCDNHYLKEAFDLQT